MTITGSELSEVTSVKFGSTNAVSFTVNSATSISAVAPPGKGTVHVTVSTPTTTSATSPDDYFTYGSPQPPPDVMSISPKKGTAAGGTTVTIKGANLTKVTAVDFGSVQTTGLTELSVSEITAISPLGTVGRVNVTVVTTHGTSLATHYDLFKYTKVKKPKK
ncbi:MAG: IPT/TIG domain-containing protein [Solirubrobacteraceae bacterium]